MSCKIGFNNSKVFLKTLILFSTFIVIFYSSCSKDRPVIERNTSNSGQTLADAETEYSEKPELSVAIGAMISPEITRAYYLEILQLIADQMGCILSVSQRRTYAEVNELVENNEVDFAFVCSGAYVAGNRDFGMELLVVPVSNGKNVYYSYIITNKNSGYETFADLEGQSFVFTDPDSNTGCLVPRYMLMKMNKTPETYFSKLFYTYSHDNSIDAVAEGIADGAAVDSLIWEYLDSIGDSKSVKETKVILKSEPFGIPPVVVNSALEQGRKKELKEIFLNLHRSETALSILKRIQIERFIEGYDSDYNSIRKMLDWTADTAEESCHD